ncbi:MAG: T9SS type A sorting domain-containing protein [Saprospiraceae bacterium]
MIIRPLQFALACLIFGSTLQAQSIIPIQKSASFWQPQKKEFHPTGEPTASHPTPTLQPHFQKNTVGFRTETEQIIGNTVYDLQTNATMMNRLFRWPDGQMSAVWTQGFNSSNNYPDRGTGYNHFDGNSWGIEPAERLESSLRTGWPSIVGNGAGDETVLCHDFETSVLHQLSRDAGNPNWTETDISSITPVGVVWPRLAIGGSNGNTLHAIAIAPPVISDGEIYKGMDGHILYYRSLDGGENWDIKDMVIPGLDSTTAKFHSSDAYAVEAKGDVVVVAHFSEWNDVTIHKSTDNGDTWTTTIVNDFPLSPDQIEDYTVDDLPPPTPNQPDPRAILTSDGSGAILIDNNDQVHVFYGKMYVQDFMPGSWTYYPGTSGIMYWNESFKSESPVQIAELIDANGNGIFDVASITEFGEYGTSLTSFPSAGVDADNNIYLVYSGLTENFISQFAVPNQQYLRHIYAVTSKDGGDTWTSPFDLTNENYSFDPGLLELEEVVFPSVARLVDDKLHVIYQFDFEPGLSVQGDGDPAFNNFIGYLGVDVEDLGVASSVKSVPPSDFAMQLSPNPAASQVRVSFDLPTAAKTSVTLLNALGQQLLHRELGDQTAGAFSTQLDLSNLSSGIYFVKLTAGEVAATQRVVKR